MLEPCTRAPANAVLFLVTLAAMLSPSALALARDKRPPPVRPAPSRAPVPPAPAAPPAADSCTEARGSVRMEAYGYTHVVTLTNQCTKPVECALWTDVDLEPRTVVQAAPGESVEIITRRGSPARELLAFKSCRYK